MKDAFDEADSIGLSLRNSNFSRKYDSLGWEGYFGKKIYVEIERGKFCVYITGENGPLVVLLHGAGYSALTWANFCRFAIGISSDYTFIAVDFNGHGDSIFNDVMDWSMQSFTDDIFAIVDCLFPESKFIVVGHSLGGCIGVNLANISDRVIGLIVIDAVEGTAKEAYPYMRTLLEDRPSSFTSISEAVSYVYRTGKTRNLLSARLSVPGQVMVDQENKESGFTNVIWRTDLKPTLDYWDDWFKGLSNKFLNLPCPKLLVLPGKENLDKDLLIGQMLGKYQLVIIRSCGHFVQEDQPNELAKTVICFLHRFFPK